MECSIIVSESRKLQGQDLSSCCNGCDRVVSASLTMDGKLQSLEYHDGWDVTGP